MSYFPRLLITNFNSTFLLALIAALYQSPIFAEDSESTPNILDGSAFGRARAEEQKEPKNQNDKTTNSAEFTGIPALFSTPETGVGGGGAIVYLGPKLKSRRDFALIGVTITERKQFLAAGLVELFDSNEHFSVETYFKVTRYPDYFFGLGNDTKSEDKDLYTMRSKEIALALKVSPILNPKHQFGFGLHQEITDFEEFNQSGILSNGSYVGKHGGVSRDLTFSWQYQNNDDDFDPHEGTRISWDLYRASKVLGSDFENIKFWSNNATFIPLSEKSTLALQLYGQFSNGDIPWYQLAQPGGTNLLRGYFLGRFRDEQMLLVQTEVRRHLFRRIGAVAFAALGQVANDAKELFDEAPLVGWGFGFRFRLTRNQRINARLDIGFNRDDPKSPSLYLYILEAF